MTRFFHRFFNLLSLPYTLLVFAARAGRYRRRNLRAAAAWGGATDRRQRLYAGALAVIEALYRELTGAALPPAAQRRAALMSALVPRFDDLIDQEGYSRAELAGLCQLQPQRHTPAETEAIRWFETGGWAWDEVWQAVFEAQFQSQSQLHTGGLGPLQLDRITREKGGQAVLLGLHAIVGPDARPELRPAARALGATAQYINDLFDVWKDREAGIRTLFTGTQSEFEYGCAQFEQCAVDLSEQIRNLPYAPRQKRRTLLLASLFVALGYTARRRLQRLARGAQSERPFDRLDRKALICDMARVSNRLTWIRYIWRLSC